MTAAESAARRNVALYFAFRFVANFLLWGAIWIKYLLDIRELELKWILAMDLPFWLLVTLLQAPTGALADHIGRKRILALSQLLYAITILGFGLTTNYWMLFADYVLWAFAMATQSGPDQALLYDSLKQAGQESRFQKIVGRSFAVSLTAGLVGVVLGGFLAEATSLEFAVQISAVFPLISGALALAMVEARPERKERHYWADLRGAVDFSWSTPQVRYTLLLGAVLLTATFGPVVLIQPFLIHHNVDTALYGVYQAPLRLVSVLAAMAAFVVAARMGRGRVLVMSCAVVLISYVALATFDIQGAFALFALPALVSGLSDPLVSAHLNERIPSERRATVLSVMQLCFSAQVAFFEPALGFFADGISLTMAFVFCGGYFAVTMPPLLFLWRRAHHGEPLARPPIPALEMASGGG